LQGELARTTGQLRLYADVVTEGSYLDVCVEHADPHAVPPQPELRRIMVPVGPVLVFAASNFPFAFGVVGGDTASALAVSAPVLVKGHGSQPGLSAALGAVVHETVAACGMPPGVFGLLTGETAGRAAVQHATVRAVGFTGSTRGGCALHDLAAARPDPIPFFGELGSINPVVVLPGSDAERSTEVANGFVASVTGSTGQLCTKPGLLFVPRGGRVAAALPAAVAGCPPGAMLNERMRDALVASVAVLAAHPDVGDLGNGSQELPAQGFWARHGSSGCGLPPW
jgi:NADP-dependent aldehyde dehydrogenase